MASTRRSQIGKGNDATAVGVERYVGHLLRRAYAVARKNSSAALADLGDLSPVQATALITLASGALTQAELGRQIGMESANTHTLIKRMVAAGLVATRPDPANRRLLLVDPTAAGQVMTSKVEARLAGSTEQTLAPLTASEQAVLIDMLLRIIAD
ncbi:MarR family transcriptional regulator [Polymorphobacter sp. PAMC 29334]|uniref:MarR family winged helix-turn-helix transcriptional regulator n=1 Tax=Polymorphobacter sp. PAMC 29334 TaxID=2862331 RepID=UPI001C76F4C2|nr:MarR family transcriptional regulator [Polymorphobacter sp. PAMC 29334]QYE34704.1 MarR family transcriptional regulator [Polymorphobacter sp. PAMC 29334]